MIARGRGLLPAPMMRWLFAPAEQHSEVRDELIATVIQRRPALYIACAAIMIMSLAAALLTRTAWASAWLGIDAVLIGYRLFLSFRYDTGREDPSEGRGAVVVSMFVLFLVFGVGCAASILKGPPVLMAMAVISALGVFAGLVSRWAAFPRLALVTIVAMALPICGAIAARADGGLALAATQFAVIAITIAALTFQNHRTLLRMLRAEQQNAFLARTDPLTGLGNRVRLGEDMAALWRGSALGEGGVPHAAVLYLDLDGFKAFNDAHGHDAGDALLRTIGDALRLEASGTCRVYRIGGDEFVVIGRTRDPGAVETLAERMVEAVARVGSAGGAGYRVTVSVGAATALACDTPDTVLTRADRALYQAKRAGKARFHLAGAAGSARLAA